MRQFGLLVVLVGLGAWSGVALASGNLPGIPTLATPTLPSAAVPKVSVPAPSRPSTAPAPPISQAPVPKVSAPALPKPAAPALPKPAPALPKPAAPAPAISQAPVSKLPAPNATVSPPSALRALTPATSRVSSYSPVTVSGSSYSSTALATRTSSSPVSRPRSVGSRPAFAVRRRSARPRRLRGSWSWVSQSGKHRSTTVLTFTLRTPRRIVVLVRELAPVCRAAGSFSVAGHAGRNVVPMAARLGGGLLGAATYRLEARGPHGRLLGKTILVVVVTDRSASPNELAAARLANACRLVPAAGPLASARGFESSVEVRSGLNGSSGGGRTSRSGILGAKSRVTATKPSLAGAGPLTLQALAPATFGAGSASSALRLLLLAGVACALALLGLAALPQGALAGSRVSAVVVRRRIELALLGAGALFAVAITYLFQ